MKISIYGVLFFLMMGVSTCAVLATVMAIKSRADARAFAEEMVAPRPGYKCFGIYTYDNQLRGGNCVKDK